jgi:hypothetical protein
VKTPHPVEHFIPLKLLIPLELLLPLELFIPFETLAGFSLFYIPPNSWAYILFCPPFLLNSLFLFLILLKY